MKIAYTAPEEADSQTRLNVRHPNLANPLATLRLNPVQGPYRYEQKQRLPHMKIEDVTVATYLMRNARAQHMSKA